MTQSTTSNPGSTTSSPAPRRGIPRGLLRAGLLVLLLAATVWATSGWLRPANDLASIDQFTVATQDFNVVLTEKGELKAAKETEIICAVEGRSTIISLIPEGTAVQKGDLLVELASDAIEDRIQQEELKETNAITAYEAAETELEIRRDKNESDIRKANLDIELRQLALDKYEKGDWVERHKDAEIAIEQAKINLERRGEDFEAAKALKKRGFITKTEFAEEEFAHTRAKWDLEKAIRAKQVLETYTHVADLRKRQSDLEESKKEYERVVKNARAEEVKGMRSVEGKKKELDLTQAQLAKFRRQKIGCRISAPTQGFVVYYAGGGGRHFMSSDSQIREGATVHERQIIMTLPDTSEMILLVRIHESKTDKLRLGQSVRIRVEGLPGEELSGKVTKIAAVADSQNRWLNPDLKEYETEITLDANDFPLKPGATAHAQILVESVTNAIAVPVQTIYSKGTGRYVFASKGGVITPLPIQLGAIGTEWAEIKGGLNGGERILLAYSDEQKRLVPDRPSPEADGRPNPRAKSSQGRSGHASGKSSGSQGGKPANASQGRRSGKHGGDYGKSKSKPAQGRRTHP